MGRKNAASRKPAYIKEPTSDSLHQTTPMQFGLPQSKDEVTVSKMRYPAANKLVGSQTLHSIKIVK